MNKYTNQMQILSIIASCQKDFNNNLKNKKIMFIYETKEHSIKKEEMFFPITVLLHLTGVEVINKNSKNKLNSYNFYNLLNMGKLNITDYYYKTNDTTDLKLQILPQLMRIDKIANMLGEFSATNIFLQTEKIAGNVNACMGFVKDTKLDVYIPNTALKEDIRKITENRNRIIAILKKDITDNLYKNITYLNKNYEIEDLLKNKDINKIIDLENLSSGDKLIDKKIYNFYYNTEEQEESEEEEPEE